MAGRVRALVEVVDLGTAVAPADAVAVDADAWALLLRGGAVDVPTLPTASTTSLNHTVDEASGLGTSAASRLPRRNARLLLASLELPTAEPLLVAVACSDSGGGAAAGRGSMAVTRAFLRDNGLTEWAMIGQPAHLVPVNAARLEEVVVAVSLPAGADVGSLKGES
ncbi:hypothetical protein HK405_008670 [Cladochytrium tenue]|nr:hypothetical protein HK405_008670 [Cladochytrium tenue]